MQQDRSDNHHTVDGVKITPGLWVWDNNLDSVQVLPAQFEPGGRIHRDHWDGWYDTTKSILNGTRMVTVYEGIKAADHPGKSFKDARADAPPDPSIRWATLDSTTKAWLRTAYILLGDGQGGEWDGNPEYTRGILELISDRVMVPFHAINETRALVQYAGGH